jgi:hypothetical protein
VQAESLSQIADELYALLPAEFTAARDEQARQARAAGRRQEAAELKKLTRPTVSAWLVNQLVRDAAEPMERLFAVGQSLHDAQRELAGDRLRDLSVQRRELIAELLPEAARLAGVAGQALGSGVLVEVQATLEAALADPAAGAAVRSGRLTRALTYAGLGEVDLTAALAVLPVRAGEEQAGEEQAGEQQAGEEQAGEQQAGAERASATAPRGRPASPAQPADSGQTRHERAQQELAAAEAGLAAAAAAAAEAERRVTSMEEQRQFLRRRLDHLHRELDRAEAEDAGLARDGQQAQRELDTAGRTLAAAQRRLAKARERAVPG